MALLNQASLVLCLCLVVLPVAFSFVPPGCGARVIDYTYRYNLVRIHRNDVSKSNNHRSAATSLYVFERMSEDCIAAVVTAQEQTAKLQLAQVDTECMISGCIDHPEIPALKRTLKQYSITWRLVEPTLRKMYAEQDENSNSEGWLSGFRAAKNSDDRPFGSDLKKALAKAGRLADQMGSTTVGSHHLFLALLEYEEKAGVKSAATVDEETDTCSCGGWAVLAKMECFADDVEALDVCNSLLKNMESSSDERELVTGVGGSDKMPTLQDCGVDLTQQAEDGLLDPVFGREEETRSVVRTLIRRRKNNACLIGEPGVGKTAIAEGVAQMLVSDDCPVRLKDHRLFTLELSNLVAGTKYRGEFEERLQAIIKEVTNPKAPPTILFIDEIHTIVNAGAADGGLDASNILKPALARGDLQLIGATTISEYRKYIEKDAALERRLQPVMVKEPTLEKTLDILKAVQSNYENHHGVQFTPEAIAAAASLSDRYISDRFLPDKALDLLDEAGATAHLEAPREQEKPIVDEKIVAQVISEWSGIPIGKLESKEIDRLRALEEDMTQRVKGQERAVRGVARAIRRARSGLRDPRRPVASFLFCGGTGTGKTELCKTLAETYYGSEKDMVRIDMSEYMDKFSVSRLTGPPPGYVGYEEGGQLTEAVRRSPHSVVLLDELEKAHGDVLNILLQVMEDGILTDGKGRTINFKNTILVMTSNVGGRRILDVVRAAESTSESNGGSPESPELSSGKLEHPLYSKMAAVVKEELENEMKPEFLNRIDEIVVFSPLSDENLSTIAGLIISNIAKRAASEQNLSLTVDRSVLDQVAREGSASAAQFGARPIRRAAQRYVEDTLSDAIIQGFLENGGDVTLSLSTCTSKGQRETVKITRGSDNRSIDVEVEDNDGGIGAPTNTRSEALGPDVATATSS